MHRIRTCPGEDDGVIVRIPGACTRAERDAFVTLAAKGDEVSRDAIETGVQRAAALLSMQHDGALIAVAAVKRPFDSYRRSVFKDAGVAEQAGQHPLEFGYLYVEEAHRGHKYGARLLRRAMAERGTKGIYATVRTDNVPMQGILVATGFGRLGVDYSSKRDATQLLCLFVCPQSQSDC